MKISTLSLILISSLVSVKCDLDFIGNILISWNNQGTKTDFIISSPLESDLNPSNAWLSFGFNAVMVNIFFWLTQSAKN